MEGGSREEEEGKNVMMNAKVDAWNSKEEAEGDAKGSVKDEVFAELAGFLDKEDLREANNGQDDNDDGEGGFGTRLGLEVAGSEPGKGDDHVESQIVESTNPETTKPKDCDLDAGGCVDGLAHDMLTYNIGNEGRREESRHGGGNHLVWVA